MAVFIISKWGGEMEYQKVNELDRLIKNFTPEQMDTVQKLAAEWDGIWRRHHIENTFRAILPDQSRNCIELAFDDCATGPRETSDALDLVISNILFKAACYKYAEDMIDLSHDLDD